MRWPWVSGILVLAALIAFLLTLAPGGVHGDTPTPSPTVAPTPTSSPTPTPYPQSTITIRFARDGQPIRIALTEPFSEFRADGVVCDFPIPGVVVVAGGYSIKWPTGSVGFPQQCTKGPPTTIRVEFLPYDLVNDKVFPPISVEFRWEGGDMVVDLDVPDDVPAAGAETPSPSVRPETLTPSGAVTATPGALPSTGGVPEPGPGVEEALRPGPLGVLLAISLATVVGIKLTNRRR